MVNHPIKPKNNLLVKIVDLIMKIFFSHRVKNKEKKEPSKSDDIYPLW